MSAVLIPTASEAEWLEARRDGITASEIAVVLGLSPYDSPYGLYHRKLGILPPQEQDDAMELGTYMEEFIVGRFDALHPEFAVLGTGRELYAHPDRKWQMATPDRILADIVETDSCTCGTGPMGYYGMHERHCGLEPGAPLALLETKIDGGSDEWGEPGTGEIPVHYRAQVLWQMDVMSVSNAYVAALIWHRRRVRVYELTLDDAARADLELMRDEARAFLRRIRQEDPPDVDWRPATITALKTLHPSVDDDVTAAIGPQLADRYEAACRQVRRWEQRKRLYEARIRERAGNARRIVRLGPGQVPVARRDVYEVREHVRKASTVDKIVLTPPKDKP